VARPRTNPPELPVPAHSSGVHRSLALTSPTLICVPSRIAAPSPRRPCARAVRSGSARKSDWAVRRCFRGAVRSASRMASMKERSGPIAGRSRSLCLRSGGSAFARAWRTIRRCTPSWCATPLIVPTPNSYSLRICSNSSTFACMLSRRTCGMKMESIAVPESRRNLRREEVLAGEIGALARSL